MRTKSFLDLADEYIFDFSSSVSNDIWNTCVQVEKIEVVTNGM